MKLLTWLASNIGELVHPTTTSYWSVSLNGRSVLLELKKEDLFVLVAVEQNKLTILSPDNGIIELFCGGYGFNDNSDWQPFALVG